MRLRSEGKAKSETNEKTAKPTNADLNSPKSESSATASWLSWFLRCSLATVVSFGIHTFFYSSAWLHGYIWAMNQSYGRADHVERSKGLMYLHHELLFPKPAIGCLYFAFAAVMARYLRSVRKTWSVGQLWRTSWWVAILYAALRNVQECHRLFPTLHEATALLLITLATGLCLMLRCGKTKEKTE